MRPGLNQLTLQAAPFRIEHELEPVYLLGSFTLRPADRGFIIAPDRPLSLPSVGANRGQTNSNQDGRGWQAQGHPFYANGVAYRQTFEVGKKQDAYRVALGEWQGSVARIIVNQKLAGHVFAPPCECDVTRYIRRGHNTVEVVVIGTLKNTLGPHHGKPGVGSAWPSMFQTGPAQGPPPGNEYHTLAYGLFEPFALLEYREQ